MKLYTLNVVFNVAILCRKNGSSVVQGAGRTDLMFIHYSGVPHPSGIPTIEANVTVFFVKNLTFVHSS